MSGNYEDRRKPPRANLVTSVTITTVAVGPTPIALRPSKSGRYFTFENAGDTDIHIIFGLSTTATPLAAPTATTNGGLIRAGESRDWYIETVDATHFNALAITSSSTLRYWPS